MCRGDVVLVLVEGFVEVMLVGDSPLLVDAWVLCKFGRGNGGFFAVDCRTGTGIRVSLMLIRARGLVGNEVIFVTSTGAFVERFGAVVDQFVRKVDGKVAANDGGLEVGETVGDVIGGDVA